jgi:phytoene desaturase
VSKRVAVIGGGFSGLSAAAYAAKAGHRVTLFEKHDQLGGRARVWRSDGFTFDMGPSWYWMPDVFERWFADFGEPVPYELKRLDPGYGVIFADGTFEVPASVTQLAKQFEALEPGAGQKLEEFLSDAALKYRIAMGDYVQRPSLSISEFIDRRLIVESRQLEMFTPISKAIRKRFAHPWIRSILEFPVLFLGGTAEQIPAMYALMNHADLSLGTWYPMPTPGMKETGMALIVEGMAKTAARQGAEFRLGQPVLELKTAHHKIEAVNGEPFDAVLATGDYAAMEKLLAAELRGYSEAYWGKRTMSPSCLLFYLGVDRPVEKLQHHNLFFDEPLAPHAELIFRTPGWPEKPLFYVCAPSKTDSSCAPEGMENLFLLVPLSGDLEDSDAERQRQYDRIMTRLEIHVGHPIRPHVIVQRSYAMRDFAADYSALRGNAYGLANTLLQTAFLKPRLRSQKVKNLIFAGQLTVPGPGVPPSLISGRLAAEQLEAP